MLLFDELETLQKVRHNKHLLSKGCKKKYWGHLRYEWHHAYLLQSEKARLFEKKLNNGISLSNPKLRNCRDLIGKILTYIRKQDR